MSIDQAPRAGAGLGERQADSSRRGFLKRLGSLAVAATAPTNAQAAWGGLTFGDAFADFFQQHYQRITAEEIQETLQRIERKAHSRYGVDIQCKNTPPQEGACSDMPSISPSARDIGTASAPVHARTI